jgi:signal transduction histidine kinase
MDDSLLQLMLDVSYRMAETRVLQPLLDYAVSQALALVKAERGYIVLAQPDGSLDFRVKRDFHGNELEHPELQISTSILSKVIQTGKPLVVTDALSDMDFQSAPSVRDLQLRSVMCVPLTSRGATLGAIFVENRTQAGLFVDDDVLPLTFFANQAAVYIENAILNDELESRVAARTAELEEANSQLELAWTQAVETNRWQTTLLANVAHDLRAPLGVASGALVMLKEGYLGDMLPEQHEWVSKSLSAVNIATRLTNDIFDLTKIQTDRLTLTPEEVPLRDFLSEIYKVADGLPRSPETAFNLQLPDDLPHLMIDPTRMQQVLLNLVANAMKFTASGSVTLYAGLVDDQVLIGVADTGEGIPADKLDSIFERFQQVDANVTRRQAGSGLGLAISRELVEMHGGQIWAESEVGVGTDFKFVLPLAALSESN